jgi:hypothetical protein
MEPSLWLLDPDGSPKGERFPSWSFSFPSLQLELSTELLKLYLPKY